MHAALTNKSKIPSKKQKTKNKTKHLTYSPGRAHSLAHAEETQPIRSFSLARIEGRQSWSGVFALLRQQRYGLVQVRLVSWGGVDDTLARHSIQVVVERPAGRPFGQAR